MSARGDAAGIALSFWLLLFRVTAGLSFVVDAGFDLGLFRWVPANPGRLTPPSLGWPVELVELVAGVLLTAGISSRFFVALLSVQVVFSVGLECLRRHLSPFEVPNFSWLAVLLLALGIFGPGRFSVDAWRPRLLPKLLLRLREGSANGSTPPPGR